VHSSVRKITGLTILALLASSFAFASVATAAETDPGCAFDVTATDANGARVDLSAVPGGTTKNIPASGDLQITVTGLVSGAADGTQVSLVLDGDVQAPQAVNSNGSFTIGPVAVTSPVEVGVQYSLGDGNLYTKVCVDPGGQTVVRVGGASASVAGASAARSLAFTGSSDATRNALLGLAALLLGTVLVIGTRRRKRIDA
jgi:hypothetical protein